MSALPSPSQSAVVRFVTDDHPGETACPAALDGLPGVLVLRLTYSWSPLAPKTARSGLPSPLKSPVGRTSVTLDIPVPRVTYAAKEKDVDVDVLRQTTNPSPL